MRNIMSFSRHSLLWEVFSLFYYIGICTECQEENRCFYKAAMCWCKSAIFICRLYVDSPLFGKPDFAAGFGDHMSIEQAGHRLAPVGQTGDGHIADAVGIVAPPKDRRRQIVA